MGRRGTITGVWTVDSAVYVFAKLMLGLVLLSFVGSLLAAFVPGSGVLATIALLVPYAAGAYYVYDNWPPWFPKVRYRFDNEIDFDPHSDHHNDVSEITIDDVATVLEMLETDAERFGNRMLKDMSMVLFYGTRAEGDPSRVLAQLERVSGVSGESIEREAFGRLFELVEAAETGVPYRAFDRVKHWKRKALLASFGGDSDIDFVSNEENVKGFAARTIYHFSREYPPLGYEQELRDMLDYDSNHVRAPAAYALGTIGRYEPDRSDEIFRTLAPLTNDENKEVRRAATYGLVGPAFHSDDARAKLEELASGRDPDLRDVAREGLEAIEDDHMNTMDEPVSDDDGKKTVRIGDD